MADDSMVEYELNEYEILDENETQNIEQIYVIANDDSDEQFDGNFSIESIFVAETN